VRDDVTLTARSGAAGEPTARRPGRARLARPVRARLALPRPGLVACLAAGALGAGLLSGCASHASAGNVITVNTGACGTGWQDPKPGLQTLQIYNSSTEGGEIDLIDPANGAIYAEVGSLGPGTTAAMYVNVGSGSYAFRCLFDDTDPMTGAVIKVGGHVRGGTAILPVTDNDLIGPAKEYQAYVTAGLTVLAAQTQALAADVQAGNLAAARAAWLPAHLTYERLGAAYGTFGNYDTEIDGRATGLPAGVNDPNFTGFYRVEYGLWHGQTAQQLAGPAGQLYHDVLSLQAAFPTMEVSLLDIGLRTHEILENALEFQLTGIDDYGSGTTLATTAANITGTRELLQILNPLLVVRYRGLPQVYVWLNRLQSLIDAQQQKDGSWTAVGALSTTTRQQLDAACSQALQELAPIAVITEPRTT
jgi:iron uptake system component EfeO